MFLLRIILLLLVSFEVNADTYSLTQTLSPSIAGTEGIGDGFGQTIKLYDKWMFVSAPNASPDGKPNAGAIYIYRRKDSTWTNTQIITTGGTSDQLGSLQIEMQDNWLFVSAIGTPTGPIPSDIPSEQDFTGAILIYSYDPIDKLWKFSQSIDRNTLNLNELTPLSETQQGACFGLKFSVDTKTRMLLVGAQHQQGQDGSGASLINAGAVFVLKLNEKKQWTVVQKITNPDGVAANDTFGANICFKGRFALVSNAGIYMSPRIGTNSSVYLYSYNGGQWNFLQKLTGDQAGPTTITSPSLGTIAVGDGFGASLAIDDRWAIIGSPLECRTAGGPLSGAAYFYRLTKVDGVKQLNRVQKIYSDDVSAQGTSFVHVALQGETALISDPTRTGPAGQAQGGVMVFRFKDNKWQHAHTLYDPNGSAFDYFGVSVSKFEKYYAGGDGPVLAGQFFANIGNPVVIPPTRNSSDVVIFQKDLDSINARTPTK